MAFHPGGPAAVVAAMVEHAADVEIQRDGCLTLRNNMVSIAWSIAEVVDAGGAAAVVAAMGGHAADVDMQREGCGALQNSAFGSCACRQAVVDAGGAAAVVTAMGGHAADVKLQRAGCLALSVLAFGSDARKQAAVDACGAAAVVAAMGRHAADVELQRYGCGALQNMAVGSDACKRAILGAGGLAALVAAGTSHPTCHASVSLTARRLLGDLGAFAPTAPAPPPIPPPVAELAEAERARQRAEQRAQQEQEQREEAERRAHASHQREQGLQQQLTTTLDEGAFLRRFVAFRQYVEMLLEYLPSKTARSKPWRLKVRRSQLCRDVIEYFSPTNARQKLFQRTEVTFIDAHGGEEEGEDLGGLTVELYSCFFRQVLLTGSGLFEGAGEDASTSIGLLPSPTADLQSMNNIGRIMCRCVLDDQPLGRGLGRFVFEFLADTHEWRVFKDAHSALAALSDFDPELSQRWAQLLVQPPAGLTLDFFDEDAAEEEVPPESAAMERAVLAGCRHKLLTIREASLRALRDGFTEIVDLREQLGALSASELLLMLRGNTELSCEELLACFAWPDASAGAAAKAGFAAAGSDAPRYLREIILDESPETGLGSLGRMRLLEWSTALTALPCGGLKDPITLKLYEGRDEHDLPNVHTCTHEVHLPPYATRQQLQAKLLQAVEHRHDGFHIE